MAGKVQTVLGVIDGDDLGITLTHEHLLTDTSVYFTEPKEADARRLAYQPVSIENISWLCTHPLDILDNLQLLDEEVAIEEVMHFKREGGGTVVEVSNIGLGRDPQGLASISRATGLNVVMGSGHYIGAAQDPDYDSKTEEEIAENIISDIEVGVGDTGIRAGIIGEIGALWPLLERENKSLRAAVRAQRATGAGMSIHHLGTDPNARLEIIKIMDSLGADIRRVAMCHIDSQIRPLQNQLELAKTGCFLEYDLFGGSGANSLIFARHPCDGERVEQILELVEAGYIDQILMAHDNCIKIKLLRYGGYGYAFILRYVVPNLLGQGHTIELLGQGPTEEQTGQFLTREQVNTILVENPRRLLQFQ